VKERLHRFLIEFKQTAAQGSGIYLVPRKAALETLAYLGLTKRDLEEILMSLSVVDYHQGPQPDREGDGDVWVFGKEIKGLVLYIKVKVVRVERERLAKCLSFHVAKYPMRFPFQEEARRE
jgi:hypothetical protein